MGMAPGLGLPLGTKSLDVVFVDDEKIWEITGIIQ